MSLMVSFEKESEGPQQHLGVVSRKFEFICQSSQGPNIKNGPKSAKNRHGN